MSLIVAQEPRVMPESFPARVAAARERYPRVHQFGYLPDERTWFYPDGRDVWVCYDYLRRFAGSPKPYLLGSYGLKHRVEAWCRFYIPNGALILAGLIHDFRVERDGPDSPNARLFIRIGKGGRFAAERRPVPNGVRARVLARDGFRCRRCGATSDDVQLVIDHVVPVARGGATVPENLQTLCHPCNAGKRDHLPEPFDLRGLGCQW